MEENPQNTAKSFIFSSVEKDEVREAPLANENASGNTKTWVSWGPDNRFPTNVFEMIQKSPTASSIVNGTISFLKGMHIELSDEVALAYFPYLNKDGDTIYDAIDTIARDMRSVGCFAIQVIYNKLKKKAEIYALPMEFVRVNEDHSKVWFSKKWTKYSSSAKTVKEYPIFDPKKAPEGDAYSAVYIWTNAGHRQTYGISPQAACLEDIMSEGMCAKYVKNSLAGGLASRYVISIPNSQNLTDKQKKDIEDGVRSRFCGVENAGEFMLYFQNGEAKLDVQKTDMDNAPEMLAAVRNASRDAIFVANHATPNLFGCPSATTGFNSEEYNESYALYSKMVLDPIINTLKNTFDYIFGVKDAIRVINEKELTD